MKHYIRFLEKLLKVKPKSIIFASCVGWGQSTLNTGEVVINNNLDNFTKIFTIAHELRHIYQYEHNRSMLDEISNHYQRGKSGMNQVVEMDANAFAFFICRKVFRLEPQVKLNHDYIKFEKMVKQMEIDYANVYDVIISSHFDVFKFLKDNQLPNAYDVVLKHKK